MEKADVQAFIWKRKLVPVRSDENGIACHGFSNSQRGEIQIDPVDVSVCSTSDGGQDRAGSAADLKDTACIWQAGAGENMAAQLRRPTGLLDITAVGKS